MIVKISPDQRLFSINMCVIIYFEGKPKPLFPLKISRLQLY
jgi:hypothetical protein